MNILIFNEIRVFKKLELIFNLKILFVCFLLLLLFFKKRIYLFNCVEACEQTLMMKQHNWMEMSL